MFAPINQPHNAVSTEASFGVCAVVKSINRGYAIFDDIDYADDFEYTIQSERNKQAIDIALD